MTRAAGWELVLGVAYDAVEADGGDLARGRAVLRELKQHGVAVCVEEMGAPIDWPAIRLRPMPSTAMWATLVDADGRIVHAYRGLESLGSPVAVQVTDDFWLDQQHPDATHVEYYDAAGEPVWRTARIARYLGRGNIPGVRWASSSAAAGELAELEIDVSPREPAQETCRFVYAAGHTSVHDVDLGRRYWSIEDPAPEQWSVIAPIQGRVIREFERREFVESAPVGGIQLGAPIRSHYVEYWELPRTWWPARERAGEWSQTEDDLVRMVAGIVSHERHLGPRR